MCCDPCMNNLGDCRSSINLLKLLCTRFNPVQLESRDLYSFCVLVSCER